MGPAAFCLSVTFLLVCLETSVVCSWQFAPQCFARSGVGHCCFPSSNEAGSCCPIMQDACRTAFFCACLLISAPCTFCFYPCLYFLPVPLPLSFPPGLCLLLPCASAFSFASAFCLSQFAGCAFRCCPLRLSFACAFSLCKCDGFCLQEKLGLILEKEDEMGCLVGGCNFLLKAIRHEAFTYANGSLNFVTNTGKHPCCTHDLISKLTLCAGDSNACRHWITNLLHNRSSGQDATKTCIQSSNSSASWQTVAEIKAIGLLSMYPVTPT